MKENSPHIDNKNADRTWTVKEARTIFLTVIIVSAFFLLIKSLFFLPQPADRPFLVSEPNVSEIMKTLDWYAKNSVGSLKMDSNRCLLENNSKQALCTATLEVKNTSKNLKWPLTVKENRNNWPYIWQTKAYDNEVALEFALFSIEPVKIVSQKIRPTVLGEELIVEADFKRTALAPVAGDILDPLEFKILEKELGTHEIVKIAFLPNPYGYYLPVYPLP